MGRILLARGDAVPRYAVPVELTDYPFFPGTMMQVDQARLDHLAAQHVTDIDGAPPSMKRFLFAAVPVALFDQIFASSDPGELPLASSLWLFHLSGYYGGIWLRGHLTALPMDNNIFTQIGFVVLVGLACKNAILIVEFAKQRQDAGLSRSEAAVEASRLRLRPILMTSFAFIFGVIPLVLAVGAGAEMRQALGTAVFSGMLGVTFFGIFLTPVFYVVIRWVTERWRRGPVK